ncbi:hypothetical protein [Agromyces soli]|uniref:DUF485 domain-containing protein n=1 Tax=Agromyces soli TaxID=659012 RepID=A0ABY4AW58_9MICO|nr:hypothetical protein [Agromyces soli]UOE27431.1 hypothetical protein MTP13_06520 [Agromyces soli]
MEGNQPPPARVRVTAAGTPRPAAPRAALRLDRAPEAPTSDIRGVYVRSLIRSQLRLGLVFAGGFCLATALFVAAIVLVPGLDAQFVAGVPVSWLLLAFGLYPLAITVGVLYARAAARNEARFRQLAEDDA